MSLQEVQTIKTILARLGLHPSYVEHEPVLTSEDAAKVRSMEVRQGIKSLLFTNGQNDWVIVDLPADQKADARKIAQARGWPRKTLRMAAPEEVIETTGCEIGAVPPFGHRRSLPLLVDRGVYDNTESAFNIGLRTQSLRIPTHEMKAVFDSLGAIEGDFVKTAS